MPTPGFEARDSDVLPRRAGALSIAAWHIAGLTTRGPVTAVKITSMADLATRFGDPTVATGRDNVNALLFDSVEEFYSETPSGIVFVSRDVGPAAAASTLNLSDGTATTFVVKAGRQGLIEPGIWGDALNIAVLNSSGARAIQVTHDTLGILETSPFATAKSTLLAWAAASRWIVLTEGIGTGLPTAITATTLATGADDRASIGDADSIAAINRHANDNGPGGVSYPGNTDDQVRAGIQAHADANGRLAILDPIDTIDYAAAASGAVTPRATATTGRSAMYWPWGNRPPLVVGGTPRPVPPSAIAAGVMARNGAQNVAANQTPAGTSFGSVRGIASLRANTRALTDAQRGTLNDAGVNLVQDSGRFGIRLFGGRTLADPTIYPTRKWVAWTRLFMEVQEAGYTVLDRWLFEPNAGSTAFYAQIEQELWQIVAPYFTSEQLFGETLQDAADVQVESLNTPETAAAGYLYASIALRPGPPIEREVLNLVRVDPTATVNAA